MDRILFADDEKNLRETFYDYFTAHGFSVTLAADGEAALAAAAEQAFDCVILDVMMPGTDGLETCRAMRDFSDAPILFLSALGEERDLLGGYGAGADDYVTKPYSLAVLCEKCRAMIARSRGADAGGLLQAAGITLDPGRMTVTVGARTERLTAKIHAAAVILLGKHGKSVCRCGHHYRRQQKYADFFQIFQKITFFPLPFL